jgi:hypothetical protein
MDPANKGLEGSLEPLLHFVWRQNASLLNIKKSHLHKIIYRSINPCLNPENYTKNRVDASSYPLISTVVLIDMNDGVLDMNAVYDELKDETEIIKVYGDGHKFESSLDLIAIHLDGLINSYNLPLTD